MICQLCDKDKELICSHIIPRSFFRSAFPKNNGLMVSKGEYSKRLLTGIYDIKIVCDDCEKRFASWDDYGNSFFNGLLMTSENTIQKNGKDIAMLINNVNYTKLKLFLLSVLWRASVCKHSFFDRVSLGPFESKLKEKILARDPGNDDEFAVIILKFDMKKYDILHPPHKFRLDSGINGYKLYFFNAEVFIKVDTRSIGRYSSLILSQNKPLFVSLQEPPDVIRLLNDSRQDRI